ncbi:GerAB/ArcD/ProY family transporter [Brevibacillus sp. NRS-1366]|uniref:GerAB/ArcD/ProY family transporter n=1 Tax=Brevibacillus sp. NRS-1366 TaxID=3233899 RepID=UPI003D1F2629
MIHDAKINARQFGILVALYSIGTTILIIPSGLAAQAKQDAWIAAVLGVALGLLLVGLYSTLGNLLPTMTLVEMNEYLLGKWVGKAISTTFVFFNLVTAAELLYFVGNFLTTQIMPETPMEPINIIFACVIIMGVQLGIETLARSAELLFPLFIFLFFILIIFVSPQIELERIQPVLEADFKVLLRAAFYFSSVFSIPIVVLLMVFPVSVNRTKAAQKTFFSGMLIGGIVLIIIIALSILVLGPDTTARQTYPSYALAKKINVGKIFTRIEIVMAVMWFISIFFKVSFYFYAAVVGLAQTLNLKEYRFLVLPMGIIMIVLSMIVHPNVLHSEEYNKHTWLLFVATFGVFLPLLLLGVAVIRKKGKASPEQEMGSREEQE